MLTVIEAGRHASPLISKELESVGRCIERCQTLVEDMSGVKSVLSKEAISAECAHELDFLSVEFSELKKFWEEFNDKLESYKYRERKKKANKVKDLPGQQVLFEDVEAEGPTALSA